ncbi:hypothetical protein GCM10020221_04300 [Streptomyces thioluteus]|uniref:Aspartate/ornithine carbamoyltransferase Asp/Orn-binding domain-containing protein n=1 Tax=Streptomyces thioluteus TaxID=66431 RepID=A0ABN3WEL8_STRTU
MYVLIAEHLGSRRLVGPDAGLGQDLAGAAVTVVGDILHSRVARSNVHLLTTLGAEVTLVAPPTLVPFGVEHWPCEVSYDLDAVLPKSDAVMMLRVQRERMNAAFFPTEREYARRYGLDGDRMARMPEGAIVMHPGPMNRGMEITAEVADSDRCHRRGAGRQRRLHPHGRPLPAARRFRVRRCHEHPHRGDEVVMSKILIRGAQVLGGEPQDVLIEGETIAAVGTGLGAEGAQVIEAEGKILLPGLVDLHTHLREPGARTPRPS